MVPGGQVAPTGQMSGTTTTLTKPSHGSGTIAIGGQYYGLKQQ